MFFEIFVFLSNLCWFSVNYTFPAFLQSIRLDIVNIFNVFTTEKTQIKLISEEEVYRESQKYKTTPKYRAI